MVLPLSVHVEQVSAAQRLCHSSSRWRWSASGGRRLRRVQASRSTCNQPLIGTTGWIAVCLFAACRRQAPGWTARRRMTSNSAAQHPRFPARRHAVTARNQASLDQDAHHEGAPRRASSHPGAAWSTPHRRRPDPRDTPACRRVTLEVPTECWGTSSGAVRPSVISQGSARYRGPWPGYVQRRYRPLARSRHPSVSFIDLPFLYLRDDVRLLSDAGSSSVHRTRRSGPLVARRHRQ